MTDFTSRAATVDDVADVHGGAGAITRRARSMDDWATTTGRPMGTYDDLATGAHPPEPPARPVARFTFSPASPVVGEEITFDGSSSEGEIDTYEWLEAMSDERREGVVVRYTFATAGRKAVVLTVVGPGSQHQGGQNVEIAEAPE